MEDLPRSERYGVFGRVARLTLVKNRVSGKRTLLSGNSDI